LLAKELLKADLEKKVWLWLLVLILLLPQLLCYYIMGWKTPHERARGVALAIGAAQVTDGLMHLFTPDFYSADRNVGLACAGNIFYGAGLLGIFQAYM
jgi:hypothetical protein